MLQFETSKECTSASHPKCISDGPRGLNVVVHTKDGPVAPGVPKQQNNAAHKQHKPQRMLQSSTLKIKE